MMELDHRFNAMDTRDVWEKIKQKLDDELTPDELERVIFLIDPTIKSYWERNGDICSAKDLINALENCMFFEDILSTLEHIFGYTNQHTYEGKSLRKMISDYSHDRRRLGCSNIIGREKEISQAIDALTNTKNKGIWIYGMGGLGKTLLANEISEKLFSRNTTILKFDLKQVTKFVDFIKRMLAKFEVYTTSCDTMALTRELMYQLKSITCDTCIVLDNIEDMYKCERGEVNEFVKRCFDSPAYMPIKWMITSKIKFDKDMHGLVQLELQPLSESSAEHLLNLSIRPIELEHEKRQCILVMTGKNPLAIRLISSAVKSYKSNDDLSFLNTNLQNGMKECIEYAYRSLTEADRVHLNSLSVVETSQFDLEIVKAVLEKNDQEALLIMMKLINHQVVQRICYRQYCFHPLILEYVRTRLSHEERSTRAQNNFCQHMIERLEPYVQQAEKDYPKAIAKVSENQPLLKVLFSVLSTRKDDSNNIFTTDTNKYLIQLRDMLPMTQKEKQRLYKKITDQMKSDGKYQAYVFWKLEEIRMMVDNKCFVDAEKEISKIDEILNDMANEDTSIAVRFWYIKGRFFRCKEYKEYTKASECFRESYQCNMNTDNVPESAIALNALGNTYFDMNDDENALIYHQKAFDLLQTFLLNDLHPDLSVYEFNIGTIYLSKASKQLSICKCVTDNVKGNLEKALQIFEKSMAKDEKMKTHRMPKYGNKLAEKAKALFYLSDNEEKRKEAIDIMKESLTIKVAPFTEPDKNKTLAIFKTGQTFINWREDVSNDKTIAKLLLKEAIHCFRKAEDEIRESESASLDGKDKTDFISVYEKIASQGLVSRKEAKLINSFCEEYKTGALFESFSSNESSSSNSDLNTSAITNQDKDDSDEGYSGKGILSAETEKQNAAQFEKDFYLKLSAQSAKDIKKRRHSDSSGSD